VGHVACSRSASERMGSCDSPASDVGECGWMRIVPLNVSAVWGNEIVLQLIELYQNHGFLWDTSNRDYKNKIKKNYAWEDIANALKLPRKEVEVKVHTLRSQFLHEKKKISCSKTTGSGWDDVKSSLWFAYDSMKFY
jgi:hypothetical protein